MSFKSRPTQNQNFVNLLKSQAWRKPRRKQ